MPTLNVVRYRKVILNRKGRLHPSLHRYVGGANRIEQWYSRSNSFIFPAMQSLNQAITAKGTIQTENIGLGKVLRLMSLKNSNRYKHRPLCFLDRTPAL
jgi:hypothetical protein